MTERPGSEVVLNNRQERIVYTSENGCKGFLYNWHFDAFTGGWHYSMSIRDETGLEVLHSYNAKPKSKEELKNVVDGFRSLRVILEKGW